MAQSEKDALRASAGYGAVVALLLAQTLEREPYDDAYFFKRFGLNFVDHGAFAWNLREGPVYGCTSQLWQALSAALVLAAREYTVLFARGVLALCLVLAFYLLLRATRAHDRGACAAFACCSPVMLFSPLSGMESALAFALLAGFVVLACRREDQAWSRASAGLLVLAWLARPDTLLLTLPLWLGEGYARRGRRILRELAGIALVIGLCCLFFRFYYGTALPLPFYAKQRLFSPYDAHFIAVSNQVQRVRFGFFLCTALPLACVALRLRDRRNLVLLASVLAFELYHLATTIEVMGMHGRFYAPALPLLVLAGARGFERQAPRGRRFALAAAYFGVVGLLGAGGFLPGRDSFGPERVPPPYYASIVFGAALLLLPARAPIAGWGRNAIILAGALATAFAFELGPAQAPSDDQYLTWHTRRFAAYRGLDTLRSCFGDAIHVYHSEVGVPGLRFMAGTVTDLAGLMSKRWLFARKSFDAQCSTDLPEAIFLPHKNYFELNQEIIDSQCLTHYRRVIARSSCPLYVRGDLYRRYRHCAAEARH